MEGGGLLTMQLHVEKLGQTCSVQLIHGRATRQAAMRLWMEHPEGIPSRLTVVQDTSRIRLPRARVIVTLIGGKRNFGNFGNFQARPSIATSVDGIAREPPRSTTLSLSLSLSLSRSVRLARRAGVVTSEGHRAEFAELGGEA